MNRTDVPPRPLGGARVATDRALFLAEGPVWDASIGRLRWVDIMAGDDFVGELLADGSIVVERVDHSEATVGAVVPGPDGAVVLACGGDIVVRAADGGTTVLARVLPPGGDGALPRRRLNDGACDPAGRLLVGSLRMDGPSRGEVLVRVEDDGAVTVIDDDLTLSNGLAWSLDGTRLYSVDTLARRIHVRDYDAGGGATGERSTFVELDDGFPDGICVDAEDHVWVAVFGGGRVHRYAPDGGLEAVLELPAPQPTSVAFAGPDLGTLVVTTATENMDDAALAAHPLSGRFFTVEPGVRGAPTAAWNGRAGSSS